MKCFRNILAVIVIILLFSEIRLSFLKRKKKTQNKDSVCTVILFPDNPTPVPIDANNIFPLDAQTTNQKTNAEKQLESSRKMIYFPGPKVKALLKVLATKILTFYEIKGSKLKQPLLVMISKAGTDANRQINDKSDNPAGIGSWYSANFSKDTMEEFLLKVFTRLRDVPDEANAIDITGFLGLLGDLAACNQDVYGREKKKDVKEDVAEILTSANLIPNYKESSIKAWKMFSPDSFYPDPQDPKASLKAKERATCFKDATKSAWENRKLGVRAGINNLGPEVDANIIKLKNNVVRMPQIEWPFQTVPKKIIDTCKDEVWAGHYSGSIYELIFIFDALTGKDSTAEPKDNDDDRRTKAALASAFLLSTGFHTAVEINYVIQNYLKKGTFANINDAKVCSTATSFITKLIDDQNK